MKSEQIIEGKQWNLKGKVCSTFNTPATSEALITQSLQATEVTKPKEGDGWDAASVHVGLAGHHSCPLRGSIASTKRSRSKSQFVICLMSKILHFCCNIMYPHKSKCGIICALLHTFKVVFHP